MTHSLIFEEAARQYRLMKEDWWAHVDAAYRLAETETNGVLVNKAGREKGIHGTALFTSNHAYAMKYASEELKDHWLTYPRPSLQKFEEQWLWSFQSSER